MEHTDVDLAIPKDTRALEMYEELRELNPHLPDPSAIAGAEPMRLVFGRYKVAVLELSLFVKLPITEDTPAD